MSAHFALNLNFCYTLLLPEVPILTDLFGDTNQTIYADLPSFPNPSIITGDDYRPDQIILTKDN
jgi:hypothetical protein